MRIYLQQPDRLYEDCVLCPRRCHVNRFERSGFCGAGVLPKVARAAMHHWEEPCISGSSPDAPGSGAVFFSHCTLRCVFCQNHEISEGGFGKEISVEALSDTFLRLQEEGALNINLVTATHFLPSVIRALELARPRLRVPVVYNCGGYETAETVRMLEGLVDIWLPDMKYHDDALALSCSGIREYCGTATAAIGEMIRLAGPPVFADIRKTDCAARDAGKRETPPEGPEDGLLRSGVVIRHLVLPGHRLDSISVVRHLAASFPPDAFLISLLSQYTPFHRVLEDPSLAGLRRRLTSFEYDSVVKEALRLGLRGYMQEKSSAKEEYTPSFDLEGVP